VREANDRGLRCVVIGDCCGSYFPAFHAAALAMVAAQGGEHGGIFGWVSELAAVRRALAAAERAFSGPEDRT
jgi:biuret amidohydrolase